MHVALTAHRWTELRPAVRDLLGTRIELRQAEAIDSVIDRKAAKLVPDAPGRGLSPDGCGVLVADSGPSDIAEVAAVCRARGDERVPALKMLPARVEWSEIAPAVAGGAVAVGLDESALAPVLFDADRDRHLLIFGPQDRGGPRHCGPIAGLLADADSWSSTTGAIARRRARRSVGRVRGFACSGEPMVAEPPGRCAGDCQARTSQSGTGPRLVGADIAVVTITTSCRVARTADAAGEFIPHAADIGLHMVRPQGARRRDLHNPVPARQDQGAGLVLDGDDGRSWACRCAARRAAAWVVQGSVVQWRTSGGGDRCQAEQERVASDDAEN